MQDIRSRTMIIIRWSKHIRCSSLSLFESVLHLTHGKMIVSGFRGAEIGKSLSVGVLPKNDRSRDLKDAVDPIIQMTGISVTLTPNGTILDGSPYVCTFKPLPP